MALTYDESSKLMMSAAFLGRVKTSVLKFADYVLNEQPNVAGHYARIRWAQGAYANPDAAARTVQPPVVMDPAIQAAALTPEGDSTATDQQVQSAVEGVVNKIL
jgi:hypothetical protein